MGNKPFLLILNRLILILHLFVWIGGMLGGLAALLSPQSPMGIPVDVLKHSPFANFLIPGILLFGIIGIGNIFCAIMAVFNSKHQGCISSVFGWALVIWIIVQCIMLRSIAPSHVLFFFIGLVQAKLALFILFHDDLFPANIILRFIAKLEKRFPDNAAIVLLEKLKGYLK